MTVAKRKPFGTSQGNRPIVKRSASIHSIPSSKHSSGRPPLPNHKISYDNKVGSRGKKKEKENTVGGKENIPIASTDGVVDHSSKTPLVRNAAKKKKRTTEPRIREEGHSSLISTRRKAKKIHQEGQGSQKEISASASPRLALSDRLATTSPHNRKRDVDPNKNQQKYSVNNSAVEYLFKNRVEKQSESNQHYEKNCQNGNFEKERNTGMSTELLLHPPINFQKDSSVVIDDGYEADDGTDCDTVQVENPMPSNENKYMERSTPSINSFIRGNNKRTIDDDGRPLVTKGMMKRARISQVDNKGIIAAMLDSCTEKTSQVSAKTPSTLSSIVGVTVGGNQLHRSDSLDASEVTMQTMETMDERGNRAKKIFSRSRRHRWRRHLSRNQNELDNEEQE
eukprot:15351814-Ditylum_brightwellii.AAC.1